MAERANVASFEYLDTVADVEKFTSEIATTREIALDTEGASFHRFVDRVYLLQLSTRTRHAVVDPLPIGVPAGLGALLEDPSVEVVFHDADYDLRLLQQDYGWQIRTIFDNYSYMTEIIVASVRNPVHVLNSALIGADIATIPYSVMVQLAKHPLTDAGIKKFLADWESVPK